MFVGSLKILKCSFVIMKEIEKEVETAHLGVVITNLTVWIPLSF